MVIIDRKTRDELRQRYRDDKLYKAWSHPLKELVMELGQPQPEAIWLATEKMHLRLRELGDDAAMEIDYVFGDWVDEIQDELGVTRGEAVFTTVVVSMVLMSQLCAAKPHVGRNPNQACCKALARILTKNDFLLVAHTLLEMLRAERFDLNDEKVIIPVMNYLDEAEHENVVSEATRKEIAAWADKILEKTQGLGYVLRIGRDAYRDLWIEILSRPEMLTRIKEVSPRGNAWAFNLKMVSNVLGILLTCKKIEDTASGISTKIGMSNSRNYINYHADYSTSNCVFTEQEHKWVTGLVKAIDRRNNE